MLERVIENWLTRATEREFQRPFCWYLQATGQTVLHLSRHCGMELGKDVISVDKDGKLCAFQLKHAPTGKLGLREWTDHIQPQIIALVSNKVVHPSTQSHSGHRSFLVVNGDVEEEVSHAIDALNRGWAEGGHKTWKLEILVRGHLLAGIKELQTNFWPEKLPDVRDLLELYLEEGTGPLTKDKYSSLLESVLRLNEREKSSSTFSKPQLRRRIASAALLAAIAISPHTKKKNWSTKIDAWIIYSGYIFALVERHNLSEAICKKDADLIENLIYILLGGLCDELMAANSKYFEGDYLTDLFVYNFRMTRLAALMSVYGLWRLQRAEPEDERSAFIRDFCLRQSPHLWGEAAIPQILCLYWYRCKTDGSCRADALILEIIMSILKSSASGSGLASPYYEAQEILPHQCGTAQRPIEDSFKWKSHYLESLVQIIARRRWRQGLRSVWADISQFTFVTFELKAKWHFYRWRNRAEGRTKMTVPPRRQSWAELCTVADNASVAAVPTGLRRRPLLMALLLVALPHRASPPVIRWTDAQMQSLPR